MDPKDDGISQIIALATLYDYTPESLIIAIQNYIIDRDEKLENEKQVKEFIEKEKALEKLIDLSDMIFTKEVEQYLCETIDAMLEFLTELNANNISGISGISDISNVYIDYIKIYVEYSFTSAEESGEYVYISVLEDLYYNINENYLKIKNKKNLEFFSKICKNMLDKLDILINYYYEKYESAEFIIRWQKYATISYNKWKDNNNRAHIERNKYITCDAPENEIECKLDIADRIIKCSEAYYGYSPNNLVPIKYSKDIKLYNNQSYFIKYDCSFENDIIKEEKWLVYNTSLELNPQQQCFIVGVKKNHINHNGSIFFNNSSNQNDSDNKNDSSNQNEIEFTF